MVTPRVVVVVEPTRFRGRFKRILLFVLFITEKALSVFYRSRWLVITMQCSHVWTGHKEIHVWMRMTMNIGPQFNPQ